MNLHKLTLKSLPPEIRKRVLYHEEFIRKNTVNYGGQRLDLFLEYDGVREILEKAYADIDEYLLDPSM